jgi:hypothetical protein
VSPPTERLARCVSSLDREAKVGEAPPEPSWYRMWEQGFPDNQKSPEGLMLVHAFPYVLVCCRRGNMFTIALLIYLIIADVTGVAVRNVTFVCLLSSNTFALWSNVYWIPRSEQSDGIRYAHRVFVRISVANVLFTFLVAIPIAVHLGTGPHLIDTALRGSPLHCAMFAGLAVLMVGAVHLAMIPLWYRAAIHASVAVAAITAPCYSQLGHAQETLIQILGLALGEVVGMTMQQTIRRSFAATRAAQADHQRLTSRLEQINAEKERLTYDLLLEQQRGAAAMAAADRTLALKLGGESYGSESELDHAAEALGTGPRSRSLSGWGSEEGRRSSPAEVALSPHMRQRLNATLVSVTGVGATQSAL